MSKPDPKDIVQIQDLGWEGEGVGHLSDGRVVFVEGALPGDRIIPRIGKKSGKRPSKADILKMVQPSPDRIDHPCPHYADHCPASPLGAYKYEAALTWKRHHLIETLKRVGGIFDPDVVEIIPSNQIWGCRDRIELQIVGFKGKTEFGYVAKQNFVQIKDCLLPSQPVRNALASLNKAVEENRIDLNLVSSGTRPEKNSRLLIRDNGHSGAVAVLFASESHIIPDTLTTAIMRETNLSGIQIRTTPNMDFRYFLSELIDEAGETRIYFPIAGENEVYAGPTIFTQTNMVMSSALRKIVLENLPSGGNIIDMYGGIGAFGLDYALSKGGQAVVIDSSRESLKAGRKFSLKYKLPVEFLDVNLSRGNFRMDKKKYDALILDPPRKGIDKNALLKIDEDGPGMIIYVSCHPAALARDLKSFSKFVPEKFIPVDMFPQTTELETVCILNRK